jgi:SAM-dependent methyltransferase
VITNAEDRPRRGPLRALGRFLLWPLRRFFEPRFTGVQDSLAAHISAEARDTREHIAALTRDQHHIALREEAAQLEDLRRFVVSSRDANIDAATFVGETLRDLEERLGDLQEDVSSGTQAPAPGGSLEEVDKRLAAFLNYAAGHSGYSAQAGLWFNWPVSVTYEPESVRLDNINERIVEIPYALRATARLGPGARVLDVGAAENSFAFSLAVLGFEVVALDPRGYALGHPNLRAETGTIEELETGERFDAVTCISTIEHLGAGEYGETRQPAGADERALAKMRELTVPGGLLVLTAPLGAAGYERSRLDELLADWEVEDFTVAEQTAPAQWLVGGSETAANAVALVTAVRPGK